MNRPKAYSKVVRNMRRINYLNLKINYQGKGKSADPSGRAV